ncbi:hypothetical protein [Sinomicrobium weinanense]|uniref:Uncharacterized protein n=1 Tax=Sinomicrobium weinanense TaxID=2842200 RepID=A0A926JPR1_9FLAO|nr:hypothetical protein [Sinomicrobium weinanense]MBC9795109.1 hypothetical protein [Sinomicrobium weinanense]MBU3123760.1 hypothetical protein [Sinomicrobium weinanense]
MKKIIIGIIVLVITGVIALIFYVLTDKNRDVSGKKPYLNYINRELRVIHPTYLRWDEYDRIYYLPDPDISPESTDLEIPRGAIFRFKKVIHRNKAVSGVSLSLWHGSLTIDNKSQDIILAWGEKHIICLEAPCGYWTYPKAPWQNKADPNKYFID